MVHDWGEEVGQRCRDTLRLWRFRSATLTDAEEALRMMAERETRALILDLDLPGVDTLAMVGALRQHERTRGIAVLATTARLDPEVRRMAREHGCDAVLSSPVDADALAAELEAVLSHPGRRCAA